VSVAGVFPLEGVTRSQPPLATAVEVNDATPPPQPSETACVAGALPPAGTVKVSDAVANDSVEVIGGCAAALTSRLTATVRLPAHDDEVTIKTEPEYDPEVSPAVCAETLTVAGVLPAEGLTLNHPALLVAPAEKPVTIAPQAIGIDWDAGAAPPI